MNKSRLTPLHCKSIMLFALLFFGFLGVAQAVETAGTVMLVDGEVWIQGSNNKIRAIKMDQPLYSGDIIITGKDGELQARMQDEAIIAVRANTRLKIESYRAKGDEDDEAVFSLLIGTFRSITGWIGKYNRKKYAIKTTVATIGVRGTDHEPMYIPPPVPGMKPLGKPGLYDKVNSGRVVMINKFGSTEFGKNQAGFISLGSRKAAVRLSGIPAFFKASRYEKRIKKAKKQLFNRLNQGLIKRQQQIKINRKGINKPNATLPRLLKTNPRKTGFGPGRKALSNKNSDKYKRKLLPQNKLLPKKPALKQPRLIKPIPIKRPVRQPIKTIKPLGNINKPGAFPQLKKLSIPSIQKKPATRPSTKPSQTPVIVMGKEKKQAVTPTLKSPALIKKTLRPVYPAARPYSKAGIPNGIKK